MPKMLWIHTVFSVQSRMTTYVQMVGFAGFASFSSIPLLAFFFLAKLSGPKQKKTRNLDPKCVQKKLKKFVTKNSTKKKYSLENFAVC